jgi:hypothetical protein
MHEWQIITVCAGLVATCNVIVMAYVKYVISRSINQIEQKLVDDQKKLSAMEKEVYEIKAELPMYYVRREDFVRYEVTINAKLDRIYDRVEQEKRRVDGHGH